MTAVPDRDQDLIDDFLDTVQYVGPLRRWQDVPETETSDDEPEPEPREHFDPAQPRRPRGDPSGGQWESTGGGQPVESVVGGVVALRADEAAALDWYREGGFAAFNELLRHGPDKVAATLDQWGFDNTVEEVRQSVDKLNTALGSGALVEDAVLYRGLDLRGFDQAALVTGAEVVDKGFVSTSVSLEVAAEHVGAENGIVLEITARAGTVALDVNRTLAKSGVESGPATGHLEAQREVLLQAGTRFVVTGGKFARVGGVKYKVVSATIVE